MRGRAAALCVAAVALLVAAGGCLGEGRGEEARLAAVRAVLSDEGVREYEALRAEGYLLRRRGHYDASRMAFREAMKLYAGAMAAPYLEYTMKPGMTRDDMLKYARHAPGKDGTPPYHQTAASFRAHEVAKVDEVSGALKMYASTLAEPHKRW